MELHKLKRDQISAPPAPEQMFALAGAVVCLAKDLGKKKPSSRAERAHILLPKRLESRVTDQEGGYSHHVTHRFLGRVARTEYRRWAMRLVEPYWVCSEEDSASYRSTYAFEWTNENVVMASKRINVEMSELDDNEPDYGLQPIVLDETLFQPDFVNTVNQYESMSGPDCSRLIDDVRAFGAQSVRAVRYSH